MRNKTTMLVKPFPKELLIGLSNQDTAFISTKPHILCICFSIKLPVKWLAIVRMEHHEDTRDFSKAIEYVLTRVFGNVDNPVKVLYAEERNIHIDTSVPCQYCDSNKI